MRNLSLAILFASLAFSACKKKNETAADKPEFRNRSNAEKFLAIDPAFASISAYTLSAAVIH